MKKILLVCALVTSALIAQAQDLVIETVHSNSENVKILQDGRFTPDNNCIGFTSANTRIDLGEVDFGDGSVYNAVGINYANGYSGWGSFGILSAGTTFDDAVPFAQIAFDVTPPGDKHSYFYYQVFAANMGDLYNDESKLPGGRKTIAQDFVRPTGVKHVFLSFVGGAGNIRDVLFYKRQFSSSDISDNGVRLLNYNERTDIPYTVLSVGNSHLISSPLNETRVDNDSWGWTKEGVIVDYGMVDFGNNKYNQLVAYFKHWGNNVNDYIEFFVDDANNPENYIGTLFTGIDGDAILAPGIVNLPSISGEHRLMVKWHGGSSNIGDIHLVEGYPCIPSKPCAVVMEDDKPTWAANHYTFLNDVPQGATKLDFEIVNRGKKNEAVVEGNGNVGYTSDGVLLKLKNINFDQGQYNRLVVNHSSDKAWIDFIEHSSFLFFVDNFDGNNIDLSNFDPSNLDASNYAQYLNNLVSVVRIQGTSGWGNRMATSGELAHVTGVHDVYMYYNIGVDAGTNVFDIYLDAAYEGDAFVFNNTAGLSRYVESEQVNSYKNNLNVSIHPFAKVNGKQYTLYRKNQATGQLTSVCTLKFNNNGKEFVIDYTDPMPVDNPTRYDNDYLPGAGFTSIPIVIRDYFTASTADGGDKAGAYVYYFDDDEATASVPVYAATVDARLAMADGSAGYSLDEILADTDHNLKAQCYSVTLNNVTEAQGMGIDAIYCNHDKVNGEFAVNTDNYLNHEVIAKAPISVALKVGDNTYGTNQASVEAAILNVNEGTKVMTEEPDQDGRFYFSYLVQASLNALNIDNYNNAGGGFRVWRSVSNPAEKYAELMVRTTDFLHFDNVGLEQSDFMIQNAGDENMTFTLDNGKQLTYPANIFGSKDANPKVTLRVRGYYKARNAASAANATPATDNYFVAESIYEFDFKENVITGVYEISDVRPVKSVNYYSVTGQMSNEPFKGINLVVTTYTDGTTSVSKLIR